MKWRDLFNLAFLLTVLFQYSNSSPNLKEEIRIVDTKIVPFLSILEDKFYMKLQEGESIIDQMQADPCVLEPWLFRSFFCL
jgi:hypothetical protein